MYFTGKTFQKAPPKFKGSTDSRMSTVEVYFKPEVAKKIQTQQNTEKTQQAGEREKLVKRGLPEPEKQIGSINTVPSVKKQEPRELPIKSIAPKQTDNTKPVKKTEQKPVVKPTTKPMKPVINPKPKTKPIEKPVEKDKSTINNKERPGYKPAIKPLGHKPKNKDKELKTYPD